MIYRHTVFQTGFGWLAVVSSSKGVSQITLPQASARQALDLVADVLPQSTSDSRRFAGLTRRIRLYFQGVKVDFTDEPLDFETATAFQQSVWRITRSIPHGETRTYGWVARELANPNSSRGVGQALARNPLPILIPCHRVLAANGHLGGFTGGLEMKRQLLDLESAHLG